MKAAGGSANLRRLLVFPILSVGPGSNSPSAASIELVRHAVSECGRLGLVPCLYDVKSYLAGSRAAESQPACPRP
jgi:hypothetical protein